MDIEEKKKYLQVGRQDWTDGHQRLYGCGWGSYDEDRKPESLNFRFTPPEIKDGWEVWQGDKPDLVVPIGVVLDKLEPIVEATKYAVSAVLDQTIGYMGKDELGYFFDVVHGPTVVLFDKIDDALAVMKEQEGDALYAVYDELEFRARPDTW